MFKWICVCACMYVRVDCVRARLAVWLRSKSTVYVRVYVHVYTTVYVWQAYTRVLGACV